MSYNANMAGEEQWNDFVPHYWSVPSGSASPDLVTLPGATIISQWAFDGQNTAETLETQFEIMHDYKLGSLVYPHVHWSPSTADAGNVKWFIYYSIADAMGEFSAETVSSVVQAAGGLGANGRVIHQIVEFPALDLSNYDIGAQIRLAIRRVPGDAQDTYGADAFMHAVGIHYQSDTRGSRQRFTK